MAALLLSACLGFLVPGCGGDDDPSPAKSDTSTSDTSKSTKPPAGGTKPSAGSDAKVRIEARRVIVGDRQDFEAETEARPGDIVQIVAVVSGGDAGRTPVRISVPTAPGKRLTARVIEPAKGGKADISADSDIRLENLRYTCGLPPKTICPAKDVEVKGSSAELAFSVTDESPPIVLTADVASAE